MTKQRIKIGDKLAGLDMSDYKRRQAGESADGGSAAVSRPQTGVGMVIGAISGKGQLERQLSEVQANLDQATERLAEYDGADMVRSLDPATVCRSKWANRHSANYTGAAWEAFKEEIKSAGGNIEPIKVRRVFDGQTPASAGLEHAAHYELVYGHRRHQACLELALPVRAEIAEGMDDQALFAEMDRENRKRQNLSPWEQGCAYNQALQEGLFPSLRSLTKALGVNLSDASRFCKLAQLHKDVVMAFPSPLVIQVRWAKPLADSMQSDPDGTLERARALHQQRGKLTATEVMERLLNHPAARQKQPLEITAKGKPAASLKLNAKGRTIVEFEAGVLDPGQHEPLAKLIENFLNSFAAKEQ